MSSNAPIGNGIYIGFSTDNKSLILNPIEGALFVERDTGDIYKWDGVAWVLVTSDSGGGGSVPDATTNTKGIVELATDGENAPNVAVQGNDGRLSDPRTPIAHAHSWNDVINEPEEYPPEAHTHDWADVTGEPATYTPSTHSHDWSEVTGEPATYPPDSHSHDWNDITNEPATFTPSAHNHAGSDINSGTIDDGRLSTNVLTTSNEKTVTAKTFDSKTSTFKNLGNFKYSIFRDGSTYYCRNNLTGVIDSQAANPQTVIQHALTNGGKIFIHDGDYEFTSGPTTYLEFPKDPIRAELYAGPNVNYIVPSGFSGNLMLLKNSTVHSSKNRISGGTIKEANPISRNWTGILLEATTTGGVNYKGVFDNVVENLEIYYPNIGIKYNNDANCINGFVNSNILSTLIIYGAKTAFVDWGMDIAYSTTEPNINGIHRNRQEYVILQSSNSTDPTIGFRNVRHKENSFEFCYPVDFKGSNGPGISIHADATDTEILGGTTDAWNYTDNSTAKSTKRFTYSAGLQVNRISPSNGTNLDTYMGANDTSLTWSFWKADITERFYIQKNANEYLFDFVKQNGGTLRPAIFRQYDASTDGLGTLESFRIETDGALRIFSNRLKLRDSDNTHNLSIGVPNLASDLTLSIPPITVNDSFAALGVANIFTAIQTISNSANYPLLTYRSTKTAGEDTGIGFVENNANDVAVQYAGLLGAIVSTTAGSENGQLKFQTRAAGALATRMALNHLGTLFIGNSLRLAFSESGLTAQRTFTAPDESGQFHVRSDYSYFIYHDGTRYVALNGQTGALQFTSTTDGVSVINLAIDAASTAGGGIVRFRGEILGRSILVPKNNVILQGFGASSVIKQDASQNLAAIIRSNDFTTRSALTGGTPGLGVESFFMSDFTIDGNKANNGLTATDGIQFYGFNLHMSNINIYNCKGRGMYTEWKDDPVAPNIRVSMENFYSDIRVHDNDAEGWLNRGSHDWVGRNIIIYDNGSHGYIQEYSAGVYDGGGFVDTLHAYANDGLYGIWIKGGTLHGNRIVGESCANAAGGVNGIGIYINGGGLDCNDAWAFGQDRGIVFGSGSRSQVSGARAENNKVIGVEILMNDVKIDGIFNNNNNTGVTSGVGIKVGDASAAVVLVDISGTISNHKTTNIQWAHTGNSGVVKMVCYTTATFPTVFTGTPNLNISSISIENHADATPKDYRFSVVTYDQIQKALFHRIDGQIVTGNNQVSGVGILAGVPIAGAAANGFAWDDWEGRYTIVNTTSTANTKAGMNWTTASLPMVNRRMNPRMKVRVKVPTSAGTRLYIGFSTATAIPGSDTPLAAGDSGVILGWDSADTQISYWSHDASGSVINNTIGPASSVNGNWHQYEIQFDEVTGKCVLTVDNGTPVTLSADLPATTAQLVPYVVVEASGAAARSMWIGQILLEKDFIP